jgi:enediyne biosynthesis protein E5
MELNVPGVTIVAPKLKDPRIVMICVLTIYTVVGQTWLGFDHQWGQILTSILVACVLDVVLNYWKSKQIVLPVSGLITGMGLGLLVEAVPLWPFVVAPLLAISSKTLITFRGHHIFNPSNFGLTILLILAPSTVATIAAQWSGSLLIVAFVMAVGLFTAYRVGRWDLVLSFVTSFCIMALVGHFIKNEGYAFVFGPLSGAAFQLFTLSMITDPKTTPSTRPMRIAFGVALAVVDGVLRLMNNQHSLFIALLVISACMPLLSIVSSFAKEHNTPLVSNQSAMKEG